MPTTVRISMKLRTLSAITGIVPRTAAVCERWSATSVLRRHDEASSSMRSVKKNTRIRNESAPPAELSPASGPCTPPLASRPRRSLGCGMATPCSPAQDLRLSNSACSRSAYSGAPRYHRLEREREQQRADDGDHGTDHPEPLQTPRQADRDRALDRLDQDGDEE